jgi:hypothetical protein
MNVELHFDTSVSLSRDGLALNVFDTTYLPLTIYNAKRELCTMYFEIPIGTRFVVWSNYLGCRACRYFCGFDSKSYKLSSSSDAYCQVL